MNTLVAYDADSDDEISPRRRSTEATSAQWAKEEETSSSKQSSERRERRDSDMYDYSPTSDHSDSNFAEPPPPKRMVDAEDSPAAFRTPQGAMPHTSSMASLVSYSGDNEDDIGPVKDLLEDETPQSELREPKPPARQEESDEEEQERLIDLALEESKQALDQLDEDSPGTATPISSGSQQGSPSPPKGEIVETLEYGDEIRIPPPPDCEVSERLQATFEAAFHQKNRGVNLNQQIQGRQDFSNPMSYERFIEMFEIDEKGTNFSKNIFDPHCFPDNCYYDSIAEEQRKLMEAQQTKKLAK